MATLEEARFGDDLRLLGDLEHGNDRQRGEDLKTATRRMKPVSRSRRRAATGEVDLERLSGVDNLKQALLLRFLTRRGELADLGHRSYGSLLHQLIGEPNTETNRNRAKIYALQALRDEPRIGEVVAVDVRTRRSEPTRIDIDMKLRPIRSDTILNLVFPFFLEGGTNL